jgi:hypothetical protein
MNTEFLNIINEYLKSDNYKNFINIYNNIEIKLNINTEIMNENKKNNNLFNEKYDDYFNNIFYKNIGNIIFSIIGILTLFTTNEKNEKNEKVINYYFYIYTIIFLYLTITLMYDYDNFKKLLNTIFNYYNIIDKYELISINPNTINLHKKDNNFNLLLKNKLIEYYYNNIDKNDEFKILKNELYKINETFSKKYIQKFKTDENNYLQKLTNDLNIIFNEKDNSLLNEFISNIFLNDLTQYYDININKNIKEEINQFILINNNLEKYNENIYMINEKNYNEQINVINFKNEILNSQIKDFKDKDNPIFIIGNILNVALLCFVLLLYVIIKINQPYNITNKFNYKSYIYILNLLITFILLMIIIFLNKKIKLNI